jgi:uncharacterized protein
MLYLIDGHNLIPHIAGLSLRQMDDEMRLLELLQTFSREHRVRIEVFFDGAAPGWAGTKGYGNITAHYVVRGSTADEAIRRRLNQIPQGSGVTVISSDRQVQAEARSQRADIISSRDFAKNFPIIKPELKKQKKNSQTTLSTDEIDEWLQLFGDSEEKSSDS